MELTEELETILKKLEERKKYIQKRLFEEMYKTESDNYEIAKVNNLMGYDLGLEFAIEAIQEQLDNEK